MTDISNSIMHLWVFLFTIFISNKCFITFIKFCFSLTFLCCLQNPADRWLTSSLLISGLPDPTVTQNCLALNKPRSPGVPQTISLYFTNTKLFKMALKSNTVLQDTCHNRAYRQEIQELQERSHKDLDCNHNTVCVGRLSAQRLISCNTHFHSDSGNEFVFLLP